MFGTEVGAMAHGSEQEFGHTCASPGSAGRGAGEGKGGHTLPE